VSTRTKCPTCRKPIVRGMEMLCDHMLCPAPFPERIDSAAPPACKPECDPGRELCAPCPLWRWAISEIASSCAIRLALSEKPEEQGL